MEGDLAIALICVPLTSNDFEHPLMNLYAIYEFSDNVSKSLVSSQAWRHMPLIPAIGMQRQVDPGEF